MKVRDLFIGFIDDCIRIGQKTSTIKRHRYMIKRVLEETVGNIEITDLMPIHRSLVIEKGATVSKTAPRSAVITFRRILKYAKANRHWFAFEIEDIELPSYRKVKDAEALSPEELTRIRTYLSGNQEFSKHACERIRDLNAQAIARTRCLFEFLLHTGLRISEALSVNIEDINYETKELRIENGKVEGEWATVYLHGALDPIDEYLKTRRDDNPALFVSGTGVRLGTGTAKSFLRRLKKKVGLKKTLNHRIFRRTFITVLLRNQVDPKTTQLLARHKYLQTTLDYYFEIEKEKLKPLHASVMSSI